MNSFENDSYSPLIHSINSPSYDRNSVSVLLSNLSISIKKPSTQSKCIVYPVHARIPGGSLFAILGGSGSGKTTLLNVISGRYSSSSVSVDGKVIFEGRPDCGVGFVTQTDYLLPFLTVQETLLFAANLQMPFMAFGKTRQEIVDGVILDLGLKECADTRVGSISGGQKRRVSIAIQIISDPEVLCADEPTSGLDSFTAATVIEALYGLTRNSRHTTIICSIHQPRADVFDMFDSVLLLSRGGKTAYCGKTSEMISYFSSIGFECMKNSNPADFFVDLVSIDPRTPGKEEIDRIRVKLIEEAAIKHFTTITETTTTTKSERDTKISTKSTLSKYRSSKLTQIYILTKRFYINSYRNVSNILGSLFQAVCLGLVIMGIFYQLDESQQAIQSRLGLMYVFISSENYILSVILVQRLCTEIRIFDREYQDNIYDPSSYFISYILCSFPQLAIQAFIYALPIYFGCNLRLEVVSIINFFMLAVTMAFLIHGLAWMSVAASRQYPVASMIANLSYTFISLTSGFLVNISSIPVYVSWIKYISFHFYSYQIVMIGEFANRQFPGCDTITTTDDCNAYDGNSILESQDIHSNNIEYQWIIVIAIAIAYHIMALFFLNTIRYPPTGIVGSLEEPTTYDNELLSSDNSSSKKNEHSNLYNSMTTLSTTTLSERFVPPPSVTISISELNLSVMVTSTKAANSNSILQIPVSISNSHTLRNLSMEKDKSKRNSTHQPCINLVSDIEQNSQFDSTASIFNHSENFPHDNGSNSSSHNSSYFSTNGTTGINDSNMYNKKLLIDICADIKPGKLVALMGGSGSGKTTLLNVIAGRIAFYSNSSSKLESTNLDKYSSLRGLKSITSTQLFSGVSVTGGYVYTKSGSILFNGKTIPNKKLQDILSYVQQLDFHLPSLTVRETLQFHADLRLSRSISKVDKMARVRYVAKLLGLKECLDIRVGNEELKGISGGEKRRLSVGVQLLLDPSICLLDEPTTGLDTFTARHVVETLRDLAHSGRTVVLSIHQPRYDVFACLDEIILLSRGRQIWAGSSEDMMIHFERLGYPCPSLTNPADFILDITSIDFRSTEKEMESRKRLQHLVSGFDVCRLSILASLSESIITSSNFSPETMTTTTTTTKLLMPVTISSDSENDLINDRKQLRPDYVPLHHSLQLMIYRTYLNLIRQPVLISSRIAQNLFFAFVLALFYAPTKDNQPSVQNRIGNIYELTALTFIGMLNCMAVFPVERDVFFREYMDGGFSVVAFFLTYFIFALPFLMFSAVCLSLIMVYVIGLQPTPVAFGVISYSCFWFMLLGECIGVAFCSGFQQVGVAANITSLVISVFCMLSGNISVNVSDVLSYINYISPLKYGVWLINNAVFRGKIFTCTSDEESNGTCRFTTGTQVLELYNMNADGGISYQRQQIFHFWIMIVVGISFLTGSFLTLKLRVDRLN